MNKMIMNRLTMLAVTLMASIACFAQGKFDKGLTTSIPQGVPVGETFVYKELEYLVIENASGTYQTQVVGFCPAVLNNPDLMDNGDGNKFTPHSIEIPHYVPADNAPAMLVLSVAPDAFNTTNISSTLAAKVTKMKIDYKGEMEEVKNLNGEGGVALPTTGSTFASLTALEEVSNFTPANKVQSIPAGTFDDDVYTYGILLLPEGTGVAQAYSKIAGWQPFLLRYVGTKLMGDSDNNKQIKTSDANYLKRLILEEDYDEMFDFDGNNILKSSDLNFLKKIILNN